MGLFRQAGLDGYVMMRPQQHEKPLPGPLFAWRGVDGTELLTYRIKEAYQTGLPRSARVTIEAEQALLEGRAVALLEAADKEVWHQDYGYWYNNGCLYPDMLTVGVPLSPMNKENGCLQLIPGSNRMGRIDHLRVGQQTGADATRVQAILERVQPVPFEAEPGDALFFHCNTLHASEPNRSDVPRNLLLIAYNARRNDPYRDGPHPRYTPLEMLPDAAIMERSRLRDGEARVFSRE